jgi:Tol biopolymer transport system component
VADLTAAGVILGTFPYMAPEQIEGREADARTDVFAFGAVLFEMLTGRRAFEGHSAASLMGAILREVPPPISSALAARSDRFADPRDLHHLDYTVGRCLAKDPNDRWQSARDLVLHLRWIAENRSKTAALSEAAAPRRIRRAVPWIIATLALMTSLGLAWGALQRATPRAPVVRFSIDPPADAVFAPTNWISAPHPSVSPDGRYVAFLAQVGTEPVRLWVRALDSVEARPLEGTDGASLPFWSADSRLLGFFSEGSLKTIDLLGGASHRVCSAPAGEGGTWNREGTILFAPGTSGGLYRVPAAGGVPTAVTTPSPGSSPHRWPSFLPDGRRFVFHEGDGISLGSLDTGDVRFLIEADSQAVYSAAGYLLFVRGWTLLAQAFDATRGTVSGEALPIAEGISRALNNAAFSVSETGALIYRSGRLVNRQLTWFDRSGKPIGTVGGVHDFNGVHLSPDERRVAYHRHDGRPNGDVWIVDIVRGNSERVTLSAENLSPVWSPDGAQLAYASNRDSGVNNLWVKPSNGTAGDTLLLTSSVNKTPRSWSPDGMFIAYVSTGGRGDIWILPLTGSRTPVPFAQTEFDERDPMFSPNGRWLAYQSDESGHNEVYVRPFPSGEGRWMISTGGGATPKWRGDSRELFYQLNREVWAVAITQMASGVEVGTPQRLLDIGAGSSGWDVARDGQRILVGRGVEDRAPGALTVTLNWTETLRN